MKQYLITLMIAASAVIHAQVAEPKKQIESGDKAPARGKLEDISAQPIPDKPALGKVHGREFKVEKATLKQGRLDLWQGGGTAPHLEKFGIQISQKKDENLSGQTFTVKLTEDTGIVIVLSYSGESGEPMGNRFFMSEQYTMKLEFGTAKDGKIPGKIHLRLLDEARSFVVGTFEAEIK
jgi:hypothetical protein